MVLRHRNPPRQAGSSLHRQILPMDVCDVSIMSQWCHDLRKNVRKHTINVQSFEHISLSVFKENIGYQGWNSQNTCHKLQTGKTMVGLLLKSDLGLSCLSWPF